MQARTDCCRRPGRQFVGDSLPHARSGTGRFGQQGLGYRGHSGFLCAAEKRTRLGALRGTSPDGRPLLVEILHSVHGLVESDLEASAYVEFEGAVFRVLDPIAVLKAKTMNVRDIDQDGPSPRQDRLHLHLIARCVPEFLRDVHQSAVADSTKVKQSLEVFSRAFRTLQNKKIATTLIAEGIAPRSLLPPEFSESPLDRIRRAYQWQMKMVPEGTQQTRPFADTASSVAVRPTEGRGPKISM